MSSLLDAMSAMEGFLDPEMTSAKLLDAVRANVAEKVTTVDQAAALELKLSQEAAQFNDCLTTISNAIHKFERGEISKEEMMNESAPCVSALKTKCEALKLANVNVPGGDITEDEIATLREYIVGCKDIVAAHKEKLQACCGDAATEGLMASMENMEIATEANNMAKKAKSLKESTDAKTAAQLYMQARKLYGLGSKEKAQKYLSQAKKLYEKLLAIAKKEAKMYKVERTNYKNKTKSSRLLNVAGNKSKGIVETQKGKEVTDSVSYAKLIAYFEDRIDACEALSRQWNNKAGNQSFAETKKALKLERAKTKAGMNAREKAEKDAMKYAKKYKPQTPEEAANESALYEIVAATESMLDLMDMEDAMAMEAEGDDSAAGGDEKTAKLRELAVQLKQAQSAGDEATAKKITSQMNKLLDEIQKEAEDDITQEDVDAAKRKAVKTALIVAGAVAAVGAGTAVGVKTGAFGKVANTLKEKAAKAKEKKGDAARGETKGLFAGAKQALSSIGSKISALIPKKGAKADNDQADAAAKTEACNEAWVEAMESYMDDLELDLAMEAAMEAEGDESADEGKSPSGIAAKLRAAFAKLKKAETKQEADEAKRDVQEAAEELEDASEEAETPEKKNKLSTAAKVGIAAAATAAVAVGLTALGQQLGKNAKASGKDPKGLAKVLVNASNAICKKAGEAKTYAAGQYANATSKVARLERAAMREQKKQDAIRKMETQEMIKGREKLEAKKRRASDREFQKYQKMKASGSLDSFLSNLAFGLEAELLDDEDEYFDPETDSKAFDPEADGEDMIDEAIESDLALEAAIDVMMAEDGIEDPED